MIEANLEWRDEIRRNPERVLMNSHQEDRCQVTEERCFLFEQGQQEKNDAWERRGAGGRSGPSSQTACTLSHGPSSAFTGQVPSLTTGFQPWDTDQVGVGRQCREGKKREERRKGRLRRGIGGGEGLSQALDLAQK